MPERASMPLKATVTGARYQPLSSAPRDGCPRPTAGGVASRLMTTCPEVPSVDVQDTVSPGVSAVIGRSGQSGTLQWTTTSDVNQLEQLRVTADVVQVAVACAAARAGTAAAS